MKKTDQKLMMDGFNQPITGSSLVFIDLTCLSWKKFELSRSKSTTSYSELMILSFKQLQC